MIGLDYLFIMAGDVKRKAELEYGKNAAGDEAFQEDIRTGKVTKCFIMRCSIWRSTTIVRSQNRCVLQKMLA